MSHEPFRKFNLVNLRRFSFRARIFCYGLCFLHHHHRYSVWYSMFQNRHLHAHAFWKKSSFHFIFRRLPFALIQYHMDSYRRPLHSVHAPCFCNITFYNRYRHTFWQAAFKTGGINPYAFWKRHCYCVTIEIFL